MTGYESYVSSVQPEPPYAREEYYGSYDAPLYKWLADQGVDISTEQRGTKIVCGSDAWARSYKTADGGIVEVREEPYSGVYVVIRISPADIPAYRRYNPPLPFWEWISG